jgi:arylsulfatase A-like enzyme
LRNLFKNILRFWVVFLFVRCTATNQIQQPIAPNILLIIIDDLGYSDLGCYGGEIDTKNIDDLASDGIRFTKFYAAPTCSPTRAMLMSGMDHHQAGIGAMNGLIGPNQKEQPGYEGYLNNSTVAFSELIKDNGYRTYYTGKWDLGNNDVAHPNARGFDKAWWQSSGTPASHFDLSSLQNTPNYFENDVPQNGVPNDFYSTNFYTDQLISYLTEDEDKSLPFLGVLSYSAVHLPIHCPASHIDLYKNKYREGYEALRLNRLHRQKEIGIIAENVNLSSLPPSAQPWEDLTSEEQLYYARRMEVYAGMVDNVDDNVGKLILYLKKTGQYDNTLILLMSDNGGAGFNGWQSQAGKIRYETADNSIENLGKQGSVDYIGAGWGSAISTPFRLFKRHVSEGGLRIPLIVSGGYLKSVSNLVDLKYGVINHHLFTVRDIAPTIQEIVGVDYPDKNYKGRSVLPQTGKSFAKLLTQDPMSSIHSQKEMFGWELFKRMAFQRDGWKILWIEPDFGKGDWELYNLSKDPTETNDLAKSHPEKLSELIVSWKQYQEENNVIISNGDLFFP